MYISHHCKHPRVYSELNYMLVNLVCMYARRRLNNERTKKVQFLCIHNHFFVCLSLRSFRFLFSFIFRRFVYFSLRSFVSIIYAHLWCRLHVVAFFSTNEVCFFFDTLIKFSMISVSHAVRDFISIRSVCASGSFSS